MSKRATWEERFAAPGFLFGTAPNVFLKSQAGLLKRGQRALSVADGEGRNGVWLAEQGLDVHCVDFSPTALAKARGLAQERGVAIRTEEADLTRWTWPREAYDVVAAIFIQFTAPAERAAMFTGMKQALKKGGLLLMEGYRVGQEKYATGGPKDVEQLYTRALLENAFGDFAKLDIREYDTDMTEGPRHVGRSALVDLVGTK